MKLVVLISCLRSSKYGTVHRQLRSLTILDALIQNAGPRFQRAFADEPLLERLRVAATDPVSDAEVKAKCKILFGQWAVAYKDNPGMGRIASLYKQLPQRKKPRSQPESQVLKESEPEQQNDPRRSSVVESSIWPPSSSSSVVVQETSSGKSASKAKKERFRGRPFNLEKEKGQLLQVVASSSITSTNLMNTLKRINRESHRVSEDREVMGKVEMCKQLRRQVLRYIQYVESEQWLGSLIHANEELINALLTFEVLDKSVEDDSDSEGEGEIDGRTDGRRRTSGSEHVTRSFSGLMLGVDDRPARPPRPGGAKQIETSVEGGKGKERVMSIECHTGSEFEEDADADDDPFADRNAISDT